MAAVSSSQSLSGQRATGALTISLGSSPASPIVSPKGRISPSSPSGLVGLSPQSEGGKPRQRVVPPRQKLPREGPFPGRGRMQVYDKSEYDKVQAAARLAEHDHHPFEGDAVTHRRPSTGHKGSSKNTSRTTKMTSELRSHSAWGDASGGESSGRETETPGGGRRTPGGVKSPMRERRVHEKEKEEDHELQLDEKRAIEIKAKWKKLDVKREKDAKKIAAHVDARRDNREARFNRMYTKITEASGPEYRTGMAIREIEELEKKRLVNLHSQWSKKVYEPIAAQAFFHLNADCINAERAGAAGPRRLSRSVSFHLPGESFKLNVDMKEHPARQQLVEAARENALHRAAEHVLLSRSYSDSAIGLRQGEGQSSPSAGVAFGGTIGPRDVEPTLWNPVAQRGHPSGYYPEGLTPEKPHLRAGHGVFLPDETDNVPPAGTYACKLHGRNDKGILVGRRALGDAMEYKTPQGASSGAPAQDHFTYDIGQSNAKLEWYYHKNKTVKQLLGK